MCVVMYAATSIMMKGASDCGSLNRAASNRTRWSTSIIARMNFCIASVARASSWSISGASQS